MREREREEINGYHFLIILRRKRLLLTRGRFITYNVTAYDGIVAGRKKREEETTRKNAASLSR